MRRRLSAVQYLVLWGRRFRRGRINIESFMKKLAAEFFGTFSLVFAGTGAIIINDVAGGAGKVASASVQANRTQIDANATLKYRL